MVASMTAFGRAGCDRVAWEIRTVNHRYLELGFRLPDPLRDLEGPLRQLTLKRIRRGKMDATLRLGNHSPAAPRLNPQALANVLAAVADIRRQAAVDQVDPLELMRFPGVLQDDGEDLDRLKEAAIDSYGVAIDDLVRHRESEGSSLEAVLRRQLVAIEGTAATIRELVADQTPVLRDRLRGRILDLVASLDTERLEQEVALLAQKADVREELDRLDVHVVEARTSLDGDGPCGRRLDFLMQELTREANTLAAKSILPEAARLAVDLKVGIEQMREQVQNVE